MLIHSNEEPFLYNYIFRNSNFKFLGHPNIKVFVTQGGLQSIEEAISKGVPMVSLPFMGDQPRNGLKLQQWKIGVAIDPYKMDEEELRNAIIEVATNHRYVSFYFFSNFF